MASILLKVTAGNKQLLEKLLLKTNDDGRTPLTVACDKLQVDSIEIILNAIPDDGLSGQLAAETRR